MPWDPDRYLAFQAERFAPFEDAVRLVNVGEGLSVIDLGCGTGELTRRLADMLPKSKVLGIDSSPEMLTRAKSQARPGLTFEQRSIEQVQGKYDLVFSHAAIQWVDDHEKLIPRLLALVSIGGQLVVQMPSNHGHETHTLIRVVASESPFFSALGGYSRNSPVLSIDRYADILYANGGCDMVVMEKVYPHVLPDSDALAEWTAGTALVPYLERLSADQKVAFLERYKEKLRARFPQKPVFYGFRRTIFAATRA